LITHYPLLPTHLMVIMRPLKFFIVPAPNELWKAERYAALMYLGRPFPPIKVVALPKGRWGVADGCHRFAASKILGCSHVPTIKL
jgi:hypothetical protein